MKSFLIAVALFAAVAYAAPKTKRDVSHLNQEEGYQYPAPQASVNNQYLAPQPSVNNQYLAPQPSVNKMYLAPQASVNNQYLAPAASVNNMYLAPVAKASEPKSIELPSTNYGVPAQSQSAGPAIIELGAATEEHLSFDAPAPQHDEQQQQVGSNGGYVY